MSDSMLYGTEVDRVLMKRTDNVLEDVRAFMLKLLQQEKVFKVKVDCIQKNIGASKSPLFLSSSGQENQKGIDFDNIIFTFQVNKKFYFTKTLIEVD